MAERILLPLEDTTSFTSKTELTAARVAIEDKVEADIGDSSSGLVKDFSGLMNNALNTLSEMIGEPEAGSTISEDITTAFNNLQTLVDDVVSEAETVLNNRRDDSELYLEYFLSVCQGDNRQPPAALKVEPKISQVLSLVDNRKNAASAAGYTIGTKYDQYFNQATTFKSSASDEDRVKAFSYAALAFQEIGDGQYTRPNCVNNIQYNTN